MRLQITGHAVERWCELVDPPLPYRDALAELTQVCADTDKLETAGMTRRGAHVLRVVVPREAYLIVRLGPKSARNVAKGQGLAGGVVVTVYPPSMWADNVEAGTVLPDEGKEVVRVWADATARSLSGLREQVTLVPAAPCDTTPRIPPTPPPLPKGTPDLREAVGGEVESAQGAADWRSWSWTMGLIERERRLGEHYRWQREEAHLSRPVVAAAFRLLTGRATLADLEAAMETAKPGALAEARLRQVLAATQTVAAEDE